MDTHNDNTETPMRLGLNTNSSTTLVDLSEISETSVDVTSRDSAVRALLQSTIPDMEGENTTELGHHSEGTGSNHQSLENLWSGMNEATSQELSTPKGNRFELGSDSHSPRSRDASLGSISHGFSRQLPPLPDSPAVPSTNYDIFNPFADPLPTRTTSLEGPTPDVTGNVISNTDPSQWLFHAAQPTSSYQGSRNLISSPTWDNNPNSSLNQKDQVFDSKWAKHMEERSERISSHQREQQVVSQDVQMDGSSSSSTPVRESSRVSEGIARGQNAIAGWRQSSQILQQTSRYSLQNYQRGNEGNPNSSINNSETYTPSPARPFQEYPNRFTTNPRDSEPYMEPWRRRLHERSSQAPNQRPDIQSRNAALDTISNILFNFDCPPEEAATLLEDTCATANEVGVSTVEILAQTVTLGNFDLGMTPLCLEASRCDLSGGLDVLTWLLESVTPGSTERDLRRGCLMRNNGMGDQIAWSTMKLFVPEEEGQAVFAYDVTVDNLFLVPEGAGNTQAKITEPQSQPQLVEDSDDEGSLYDDISLIDAESSLNQADIETLKSSDDEEDPKPEEQEPTVHATGPCSTVHRARIEVPYFEASLQLEDEHIKPAYTALPASQPGSSKLLREAGKSSKSFPRSNQAMPMNNRILTAEWMHDGRVWALGMGENKLVLTLRHVSEVVSPKPIKVKAFIRIFPADIEWTEVEELTSTGSDRLLPTHSSVIGPPITPVYVCEFDEVPLVPGPPALPGNTSLCKEDIYMSRLSLLDLIGTSGAMKVEVLIKMTEIAPKVEVAPREPPAAEVSECSEEEKGKGKAPESVSGESDADWQEVEM